MTVLPSSPSNCCTISGTPPSRSGTTGYRCPAYRHRTGPGSLSSRPAETSLPRRPSRRTAGYAGICGSGCPRPHRCPWSGRRRRRSRRRGRPCRRRSLRTSARSRPCPSRSTCSACRPVPGPRSSIHSPVRGRSTASRSDSPRKGSSRSNRRRCKYGYGARSLNHHAPTAAAAPVVAARTILREGRLMSGIGLLFSATCDGGADGTDTRRPVSRAGTGCAGHARRAPRRAARSGSRRRPPQRSQWPGPGRTPPR